MVFGMWGYTAYEVALKPVWMVVEPVKNEDVFEALRRVGSLVVGLHSGSGTQFDPARTCADLKRDYPSKKDGIYYVDPNGGHWRDGLAVYCRFSGLETCVAPTMEQMPFAVITARNGLSVWYTELTLDSELTCQSF
ncbi:hypothetical protein X801_03993 [Opisthorchis viverrini]|uniref:Fibrillar collagen NC1 domain-containing protein n=1 Tax=Opisthorchis viverrini TaxID=6198 RepID=A0A1S8X0A8_OPIVI|nr:hypothetical protein X801_03993 [Opisthorchis viverrini]